MGSEIILLGELLEVLTDYHANGAYEKLKENVELLNEPNYAAIIRTTNFEQDNFDTSLKYINKHAYNFLKKSKVYAGDLIMNKIANAGSCYLMPELGMPVSLAMNLFLLRINKLKANPSYVYLYLKLNEGYVKSFANGSVTKTITKEAVRNLEIVLPSRKVQDDVVEIYSSYTNKIQLNRQTNQTLEAMAQALFKSWFVDFDPVFDNAIAHNLAHNNAPLHNIPEPLLPHAQRRLNVHNEGQHNANNVDRGSARQVSAAQEFHHLFPQAFEQSDEPSVGIQGWVPKGWGVSSISKFCSKVQSGGTPKRSVPEYWDNGAIPWLGSGEVRQAIIIRTKNFITEKGLEKSSAKLVPKGATLIAMYGATAGQVALSATAMTTNQAVCSLIPKENNKYFVYLSMERLVSVLENQARGSAQQNINKGIIEETLSVNPQQTLLEKFDEHLDSLFERWERNLINSEQLESLRDTLLPKLISGELRIPDAEQASEALAK